MELYGLVYRSWDHYEDLIQIPFYIGYTIDGSYDWTLQSVPQTQLDGLPRVLNAGKGVGGGSLINGMIWNRGSQNDYNAWEALGNPGWSWSDFLPYFMKSENYTPYHFDSVPLPFQDTFNPSIHGSSGPIHVSYPRYYWPQAENFLEALENLGIPISPEPQSGLSAGGYFLPTTLNPENQTRCDARRAYYDPVSTRPNLYLITGQKVVKVLFTNTSEHNLCHFNMGRGPHQSSPKRHRHKHTNQTNPSRCRSSLSTATAVEYSSGASGPAQTADARKEIILSAGALHTPQILQLSGIGPSSWLSNLSIPVLIDLPGVGANLQDHCMVVTDYPYQNNSNLTVDDISFNTTLYENYRAEYLASKTGPFTAKASSALAFPSLSQVLSGNNNSTVNSTSITTLLSELIHSPSSSLSHLPPIYSHHPTLLTGYLAQISELSRLLPSPSIPAYELLQDNQGALTPSLMHPLSRGTVTLSSTDPFTPPLIDPRYLTHPLDLKILLSALAFNANLLSTPPLQLLNPSPLTPYANDLTDHINTNLRTEFHYSFTCSMLPLEFGGVVDPNLRVYGTKGLRIVDSSVFAIVPGAHLMAPVYALAERAVEIILGDIEDKEGEGRR
ncbi:putative choline dehydrogenase [Phaeomoniella chlamydospora]|uniref:Putative choline dehydrogenase n=1 Tax=Phaeomoniella chlamydospora TaxID=158046 RepID=A0A0G2EY02_PHACM|nr:putative choline dehydrogenase [Phaeomoniella chlamydospora]